MKKMDYKKCSEPAVVVGLCSHGLAICRSLGEKGVPVFAIESNSELPGLKTRFANKFFSRNINGSELIEDLLLIRKKFSINPILFLTNDNMVRIISENIDHIRNQYKLNLPPADLVLKLLDKSNLAKLANSSRICYPSTFKVSNIEELNRIIDQIKFPVALKPTTPLSPFKAFRIEDVGQLQDRIKEYQNHVDCFLIQQWIPGKEDKIFFANFYFDNKSQAIAKFIGRKIRSYPRFTGGACCAEPSNRIDILHLCLKLFEDNKIIGPASLEIKEAEDGSKYLIEPTIGRFDFYILCCIRNGVDFPFIQYAHQTGITIPKELNTQKGNKIWMDFEKDFQVLIESIVRKNEYKEGLEFLFRKKAFALWSIKDIKPSLFSWLMGIKKVTSKHIK